jgi:hypothetical protein
VSFWSDSEDRHNFPKARGNASPGLIIFFCMWQSISGVSHEVRLNEAVFVARLSSVDLHGPVSIELRE